MFDFAVAHNITIDIVSLFSRQCPFSNEIQSHSTGMFIGTAKGNSFWIHDETQVAGMEERGRGEGMNDWRRWGEGKGGGRDRMG